MIVERLVKTTTARTWARRGDGRPLYVHLVVEQLGRRDPRTLCARAAGPRDVPDGTPVRLCPHCSRLSR